MDTKPGSARPECFQITKAGSLSDVPALNELRIISESQTSDGWWGKAKPQRLEHGTREIGESRQLKDESGHLRSVAYKRCHGGDIMIKQGKPCLTDWRKPWLSANWRTPEGKLHLQPASGQGKINLPHWLTWSRWRRNPPEIPRAKPRSQREPGLGLKDLTLLLPSGTITRRAGLMSPSVDLG